MQFEGISINTKENNLLPLPFNSAMKLFGGTNGQHGVLNTSKYVFDWHFHPLYGERLPPMAEINDSIHH